MGKWFSGPYVKRLTDELLRHCTQVGMLKGQLFDIEELNDKWSASAAQYMADAVPEIAKYPMVAIAWAGFYGLGIAQLWDEDWDIIKDVDDVYLKMRQVRGFDEFDEYVLETVLRLKDDPMRMKDLTEIMQQCANICLNLIHKESLEPQTIEAFQMYAKTVELMFKIGVSVQLCALGYKYEKVTN